MSCLSTIILNTKSPATVQSMCRDLQALGVKPGMTLVVHSSLSSLGYVIGGAVAVILALQEVLGASGTLAMPTHSGDLTDPACWSNPPVPADWHDLMRHEMPPFSADLTPTAFLGVIPECFRSQRGTLRSDHPSVSWAARGPNAELVTDNHQLSMSQGETSPLGRMYDSDAHVLLLGVDYACNTCFHLAEYRCQHAARKRCTRGAPVSSAERQGWTTYDDIYWYEDDFPDIGTAYESQPDSVALASMAQASSRLFPLRKAVDFAVEWMNHHRTS